MAYGANFAETDKVFAFTEIEQNWMFFNLKFIGNSNKFKYIQLLSERSVIFLLLKEPNLFVNSFIELNPKL
jgi:hypothetical protein